MAEVEKSSSPWPCMRLTTTLPENIVKIYDDGVLARSPEAALVGELLMLSAVNHARAAI